MRKVVLLNNLDSADMSSNQFYERYVALLKEDIVSYFDSSLLVDVVCPGCGKEQNKDVFKKMGMNFKKCFQCGSHYVSPRPKEQVLDEFYKKSVSCRYWRNEVFRLSEAEMQSIHGPRMNWILEFADEFLSEKAVMLDVETKYPYLMKKLIKEAEFNSFLTYKPHLFERMDLLPDNAITSVNLDEYASKVNMITVFEAIERAFNPGEIFSLAAKCCKPGGLLLITTASCSGFEYQVLGENAPKINPINRMNLLSIEALTARIRDAGFEVVELSTPGRLDVEVVKKTIEEMDDMRIDPFWKYIFKFRNEKTWQNLQKFLQEHRLSSHVWIAAKKK